MIVKFDLAGFRTHRHDGLAGLLFGGGYTVAAFAYRAGPRTKLDGSGWPFWPMLVAFVAIGMGTTCMYIAAVSTCATLSPPSDF